MPQLVTENNTPNIKVIAMAIAGYAIPLYLAIAPTIGLPTFDQQWMMDNVDKIVGGVVSIMLIVGYFKAPRQGDGVKPKE